MYRVSSGFADDGFNVIRFNDSAFKPKDCYRILFRFNFSEIVNITTFESEVLETE